MNGFTQFLNNSWWRCFYWHSSWSLCVSSLQTASMALSHKCCSSVDPFGLIAEIPLICRPASGTHLSRWPSNDITECLRQAQESPRGQEMRKTENDSLNSSETKCRILRLRPVSFSMQILKSEKALIRIKKIELLYFHTVSQSGLNQIFFPLLCDPVLIFSPPPEPNLIFPAKFQPLHYVAVWLDLEFILASLMVWRCFRTTNMEDGSDGENKWKDFMVLVFEYFRLLVETMAQG